MEKTKNKITEKKTTRGRRMSILFPEYQKKIDNGGEKRVPTKGKKNNRE